MHGLIYAAIICLVSSQNLVVDGSFEIAGSSTCNGGQRFCTGLTTIFPEKSWNAEPKIAEIDSSLFHSTSEGNFLMDLNELAPYTLYQQVSGFEVGKDYTLTFDLSRNDECGADDVKTGYARVNGSSLDTFVEFSVPGGQSAWTTHGFNFSATATSHTVYIGSTTNGTATLACGPLLDNVIIMLSAAVGTAGAALITG